MEQVSPETENIDSISVTRLKGVGPRIAEHLKKIGIETIQDVLFYLPRKYEDRTRVIPIGAIRQGQSVVVEARINHAEIAFSRSGKRRRMLLCHVSDGTGSLLLRFFYFNSQQQNNLKSGEKIRCFGEVRYGPSGAEIVHPEYELLTADKEHVLEKSLTPVYSTTEGLHQMSLRKMTKNAIQYIDENEMLHEYLPAEYLQRYKLAPIADAIKFSHWPDSGVDVSVLQEARHPLQRRLIFEELLAHRLSMRLLRQSALNKTSVSLVSKGVLQDEFKAMLPFTLTQAQQSVYKTIASDLEQAYPMMRLVQGDVGSGKTVVAAMACLKAVEAGFQSVVMAPTEILATQHYQVFSEWFKCLGLNVVCLTGRLKLKEKREVLQQISDGVANVVVGTHALFQDDVVFHRLALIVVDEQHRFGVHQRLALKEKGSYKNNIPHQLIMTATPIPRSLAMTAYADLDYSVIDELPAGRSPVKTVVISESRRADVIDRVSVACAEGRQVYWVCTLIEESEALQCQAAEETLTDLTDALPGIAIGLIHGRMKPDEKEAVMAQFKKGELELLVATTVIEVGVDVPNASLMIIENAERLGLAQLHQLRGRVGRGEEQSHCLLMYKSISERAKSRLSIMRETNSGFEIARRDLDIRGPGEVLGTKQTGLMELKVADLIRDEMILDEVKLMAEEVLENYPEITRPLVRRWLGKNIKYGFVG
ncbi:MAG: ATP-dependent DNA helicase RecG [Gammaproteobacteria bacterium]|nr:ATP-dependent DNA helicase RecG [Gammaproteobacteria bacterium]